MTGPPLSKIKVKTVKEEACSVTGLCRPFKILQCPGLDKVWDLWSTTQVINPYYFGQVQNKEQEVNPGRRKVTYEQPKEEKRLSDLRGNERRRRRMCL